MYIIVPIKIYGYMKRIMKWPVVLSLMMVQKKWSTKNNGNQLPLEEDIRLVGTPLPIKEAKIEWYIEAVVIA